jgi:hypothetical protein
VAEQRGVTVPATGEPATLTLRVMNTSAIVDGYVVEARRAGVVTLDPSQSDCFR